MSGYELDNQAKSKELCSLTMVRRVAAMLDLEPQSFSEGDILPRGWHFFLLAGETRKSELRADGFPGLGVPLPDLGLPRLLLGGRTVAYKGDILIGSTIERSSFVKDIKEKNGASGKMAIVTIQHELRPVLESNPAIIETQTYILLGESKVSPQSEKTSFSAIEAKYQMQFTPDETLLFQYSALGFNSHKIHLDRNYAQNVEGLPDLVVNGGLATLLMTEYVRKELKLDLVEIKVKHIAPLYCNRPLTLTAEESQTGWKLNVYDNNNEVTVEMEATLK
ncbi:MAG: MaoC family dehydratase N-terminal domain-containing protein [Leadbetterella sp.]|nr:MaoC family dehydratase N-terminal domain-containing protein [Leadbetterella sp.]